MEEVMPPYMIFVAMFERGKWDNKRTQRRSEINLLESIFPVFEQLSMIFGGSIGEGTDIEGSDDDYMMIVPGIHVVGEASEERELTGHVFIMREDGHRPCYPSLQLLSKDDTDPVLIANLGGIETILEEDEDGTKYLSSFEFGRRSKEILTFDQVPRKMKIYQHGPCTSVVNVLSSRTREYDFVYSIPCKTWPTEAKEWINRPRSKGWPTPEVIQKVVQTGCTLVPLGNPSSEDRHIEWRISFLLGERELMWRLNNCQYYVFITLKYILKKHLDTLFPGKISTFYMKTILFWISEERGLKFWREEKFFRCIRYCLHRLKWCIEKNSMPHYFARGNNILTGKINSVHERDKIAFAVQSIILNVVEVVHHCFGFECPSDKCILHHIHRFRGARFPESSKCDYVLPCFSKIRLRQQLDVFLRRLTLQQLNALRNGMENLPKGINEEHKSLASGMIDGLVGVQLQKVVGSDIAYIETLLRNGCNTDAMASMLQLAMFCYMNGKMDQAKVWINKANSREGRITYIGRCSLTLYIEDS